MALPNGDRIFSWVCTLCTATEVPGRPLQRCGGCQLVAYCSKECQKQDRRCHKLICKEFPVVNGHNVLHTTGNWEKHIADLRERAARLSNNYSLKKHIFRDPKVCKTCKESRPDRLTMCKCMVIFYCSKKCERADKWHTKACRALSEFSKHLSNEHMRSSYPLTVWYAIEKIYDEFQIGNYRSKGDISTLEVHVVTNTAYFDVQAWEIFFHQTTLPNLKQLKLVFITMDKKVNPSNKLKGRLTKGECKICNSEDKEEKTYKEDEHIVDYSVQQMPYHMFFSSSEYSEPDLVAVYGITSISTDLHTEMSYRNMMYSQDSVLILTDSTDDLVTQGMIAYNKVIPIDELIQPQINRLRNFGTHKSEKEFDPAATNVKYYLTCLRKKRGKRHDPETRLGTELFLSKLKIEMGLTDAIIAADRKAAKEKSGVYEET